jgi:hypothetical protein
MADSFDDTLEALLIVKEGNSVFAIGEDFEKASRWARYAFEAGRASARRQKKAVAVKDELSKAELPNLPSFIEEDLHDHGDAYTPEELEAMAHHAQTGQ